MYVIYTHRTCQFILKSNLFDNSLGALSLVLYVVKLSLHCAGAVRGRRHFERKVANVVEERIIVWCFNNIYFFC